MGKTPSALLLVLVLLFTGPGLAYGFESMSKGDLAEIRGAAGLTLELFSEEILGEPDLTSEQAASRWNEMSPEQQARARKDFRERLMDMSPEERAKVGQAMLERFQKLSPGQQQQVRLQMMKKNQSMSREERLEFQVFRSTMLKAIGSETGQGGFMPRGGRRP